MKKVRMFHSRANRVPGLDGSTHIKSIDYDAGERAMQITFRNGDTYRYTDVPDHLHQQFRAADSVGRFFHRFINGKFRHEKL